MLLLMPIDDAELLRQFEARTLPFDQWTHRCHVKVGYLYLRELGFDHASERMRTNIKAFNAAHNRPESTGTGYSETITHFFLHLIAAEMKTDGNNHPTTSADEFCDAHPQLLSKHVIRLFYSKWQQLRPDSKSTFVEPDLMPLPPM